jgi:hypothetical protein
VTTAVVQRPRERAGRRLHDGRAWRILTRLLDGGAGVEPCAFFRKAAAPDARQHRLALRELGARRQGI